MTRQHMNDKWCVRCNRKDPTPYLKKNVHLFVEDRCNETCRFGDWQGLHVLDIGCGNGRNMDAMKRIGFRHIVGFDMAGDVGHAFTLGQKPLPIFENTVDIVLANYVFMFLSSDERKQLISDIQKAACPDCTIMVELYPAKDSEAPTESTMVKLQKEVFDQLGWSKIRYSKGRFIARLEAY